MTAPQPSDDAKLLVHESAQPIDPSGANPSANTASTEQNRDPQAGAVANLVAQLGRLPGIGRKSAERLAFHLLRVGEDEALALAEAIRRVREDVQYCRLCFNLAERELCQICEDPKRDSTRLCVVEQPRDLLSLESSGVFDGLYHVLLGRIAPLDGITPDQLTIEPLIDRVREGNFREIIMATNPTVEGDGTSLYLSNLLSEYPVEITRLARGLTAGTILEHANREMIADALTGRQKL
ncbi:MAG: recombination mediator RecR [Planctomycetota bacterium]